MELLKNFISEVKENDMLWLLEAKPGLFAMVEDGEATLKRYYKDKRRKKVRLHPENDEMEDMFFDNIEIQGVAVKVIKNLED